MYRFGKIAFASVLTLVLALSTSLSSVKAEVTLESMLEDMTTEQKVTQLIMPDFRNWKYQGGAEKGLTEMNDEVEKIIEDYEFGGVIFFAENVVGTEQTARLSYAFQEAAIAEKKQDGTDKHQIPLLLGIDQEGGIVYRLGTGTALPGNMAIGATRSAEYAKNVGQIIGSELSSLGINVNFAPVLDVNNNPKNPVIGLRSYSSNPQLVADLGVATIQGLKEYNVSGAAKHFPGHGDTAVDSHFGLPEVDKSLEQLKQVEFVPFQAAMDEGIDMIMTSHIMYPQLDAEHPATLSKAILTDLVRTEMRYDGVVITDAMNMKAIADNYGELHATELAIEAGADIVLMPTILRSTADVTNKLDPIIEGLVVKYASEEAFAARVDESVLRILKLKQERGILDYATTKPTVEEQVQKSLATVGSQANRDLERQIARDAVTVVRNENNILPFNVREDEKVLLVGAYANELPGMDLAIRRLKDEGVIPAVAQVNSMILREGGVQRTEEQVKAKIEGYDYVVVISEVGNEAQLNPAKSWISGEPALFAKVAKDLDVDLAIMSISKPYDTAQTYEHADAIIAVYGAKGMDPTEGLRPDNAFGPNIPAGIEIIFGKQAAKGQLPVDLPELDADFKMTDKIALPFGHGITLTEANDMLELVLPETVEEGSTFTATVNITEEAGITDKAYEVVVTYDAINFELVGEETRSTEGVLVVQKEAGDVTPIKVELKAKTVDVAAQPILNVELVDSKGRVYTLGEDAYTAFTLNVTKAKEDDKEEPEVPVTPTEPEKDKDKDVNTGIESNNGFVYMGVIVVAAAAALILFKRKTQKQ